MVSTSYVSTVPEPHILDLRSGGRRYISWRTCWSTANPVYSTVSHSVASRSRFLPSCEAGLRHLSRPEDDQIWEPCCKRMLEMGNALHLCYSGDIWTLKVVLARLTKVAESFSLICVFRSVRTGSRRRRPSLPFITTSVLPFDQAHIDECEEHAGSGECHFNSRSSCVSWAFRCREEISRADT
jgi:hypothetical protein